MSEKNFIEENKELLINVYNTLKLVYPNDDITLVQLITGAEGYIENGASTDNKPQESKKKKEKKTGTSSSQKKESNGAKNTQKGTKKTSAAVSQKQKDTDPEEQAHIDSIVAGSKEIADLIAKNMEKGKKKNIQKTFKKIETLFKRPNESLENQPKKVED